MKALVVVGVVLFAVLAGLGGAYVWLSGPVELQEFHEPVSVATRQRNTDMLETLRSVGIEDALVNVNATHAVIAYVLPAEPLYDNDTLQAFALGVAAASAPDSEHGIVIQLVGERPVLRWEGDLAGARAVQDGTMDEDAYLATVTKTTL